MNHTKVYILFGAIVCAVIGVILLRFPAMKLLHEKSFTVTTDIPGKRVVWNDQNHLYRITDSLHFWDENGVVLDGKNPVTVHSVSVILTNKNPGTNVMSRPRPDSPQSIPLTAYKPRYDAAEEHLTIVLYVDINAFTPQLITPITTSKQYELALLLTLFHLTQTPKLSRTPDALTKTLNIYQDAYSTYSRNNSIFFIK